MPENRNKAAHRRYATLVDAGIYTSTSKWTIRRLISSGILTGYRLGNSIRVDLNEVDAAMRRIPSAGDVA